MVYFLVKLRPRTEWMSHLFIEENLLSSRKEMKMKFSLFCFVSCLDWNISSRCEEIQSWSLASVRTIYMFTILILYLPLMSRV